MKMNKQEQRMVDGVNQLVAEAERYGFRLLNRHRDGRAGAEAVTPEAKNMVERFDPDLLQFLIKTVRETK